MVNKSENKTICNHRKETQNRIGRNKTRTTGFNFKIIQRSYENNRDNKIRNITKQHRPSASRT